MALFIPGGVLQIMAYMGRLRFLLSPLLLPTLNRFRLIDLFYGIHIQITTASV